MKGECSFLCTQIVERSELVHRHRERVCVKGERERADTITHRHTDTQTRRHADTQTHRHDHRHTHTDTQTHTHDHTQTHTQTQTRSQTHGHNQTDHPIFPPATLLCELSFPQRLLLLILCSLSACPRLPTKRHGHKAKPTPTAEHKANKTNKTNNTAKGSRLKRGFK